MKLDVVHESDKLVLAHLLELDAHDLSEYLPDLRVNEHGLFGYSYLDHYWTEPGRFAYFIRTDEGELGGLVLLRTLESGVVEMAEFFVLRHLRRSGIGSLAAQAAFDGHPGAWEVQHATLNVPASAFWARVIERAAHRDIKRDEFPDGRVVYSFDVVAPDGN